MLKIVKVPNIVLTTVARPVRSINTTIKKLVKDMDKTLVAQTDPEGVGLAAPQIGQSLALFIMKPAPDAKTIVVINPQIIETVPSKKKKNTSDEGDEEEQQLEGCLSIPRFWSPIERPEKVLLSYQDIQGNTQETWFTGFEAIIVQHEMDHLQGVLFTQRALEQQSRLFEEKDGKLKPTNLG